MHDHERRSHTGWGWLVLLCLAGCLAGCGSNDPVAAFAKAKELVAKGDEAGAVVQLKITLQADPKNAQARYVLGIALNGLRDGRSAEVELRRAQELGAIEGGRVAAELGRAMLLNRKYSELLKEINPAPGFEDSVVATIQALRGRAHLAQSRLDQAEAAFTAAAKLSPDSPDVVLGQAALKTAVKDTDGAIAMLDKLIAAKPRNFEALMLKGDILRAQQQPDAAIAVYDLAAAAAPYDLAPRYSKAMILINTRKLAEAQEEVKLLKVRAKNAPLTNYIQGLIFYRQAKYREAQEAVLAGLKTGPDFAPLLLLSGAVNYSLGAFAQADKDLTQYLKRFPNDLNARKLLASTLNDMNEGKRALEVIQPALGQQVEDSVVLALMASAELRLGDFSKSISYWEKAAAADPKNAQLRHSLAVNRLLVPGGEELAIQDFEAAAALDPKSGKSDAYLVVTLLKQRQFDRALEAAKGLRAKFPKNPYIPNLMGVAYIGKKDLVNARASFEQSLALDPKSLQSLANLGLLDLQEGKPDDARRRFEKLLAEDKNSLQALLALAGLEARTGRQAESIALLQRAVKAHPKNMQPSAVLAEMYLDAKDPAKAVKEAQEAERRAPDSPVAVELVGKTQMAAGNITEATAAYKRLVTIAPKSALAHYRLATALAAAKSSSEAEATFRKALQIDPGYLDASAGLVDLLARNGKIEEATRVARDLQTRYPKAAIPHELEGNIYWQQKQYDKALRSYESAARIGPTDGLTIRMYMAESLAGNVKGGIARLEQWLKKYPNAAEVRSYLAEALLQTGKMKEAAGQFEVLIKQRPYDVLAMNNQAVAYSEIKDPRAQAVARKAFNLSQNNPVLHPLVSDTLGWILVKEGKSEEAIGFLQDAASKSKEIPTIRYHLAVALANTGQKAKAREELEKALAMKAPFAEKAQAEALLKQL